jgi:ABC-type glycerol-3-phosphate transport system permease component
MKRASSLLRHLILLLAVAGVFYPLYFMVTSALKSSEEYTRDKLGMPTHPTLLNVLQVFSDPNLIRWFTNSILITISSTTLAIVCALLAAYAIARGPSAAMSSILTGGIVLMAIPPVVLIVPLFEVMAQLQLVNSRLGVILVYSGLIAPLSVYLLVGFLSTIPRELDEAALIDGAGRFLILWHIILPLARPAILTLTVVNVVYVWNEFLIALLFLQREEVQTLMVGITSFQGRFQINEPLLMAWSLVASVPVLLLYVFGQRYLVRGLVSGALK